MLKKFICYIMSNFEFSNKSNLDLSTADVLNILLRLDPALVPQQNDKDYLEGIRNDILPDLNKPGATDQPLVSLVSDPRFKEFVNNNRHAISNLLTILKNPIRNMNSSQSLQNGTVTAAGILENQRKAISALKMYNRLISRILTNM